MQLGYEPTPFAVGYIALSCVRRLGAITAEAWLYNDSLCPHLTLTDINDSAAIFVLSCHTAALTSAMGRLTGVGCLGFSLGNYPLSAFPLLCCRSCLLRGTFLLNLRKSLAIRREQRSRFGEMTFATLPVVAEPVAEFAAYSLDICPPCAELRRPAIQFTKLRDQLITLGTNRGDLVAKRHRVRFLASA
jgi:hypothetical protein